jgi:hypothetical protein
VTVFRSRLRPGVEDDYSPVANEMSRLAKRSTTSSRRGSTSPPMVKG